MKPNYFIIIFLTILLGSSSYSQTGKLKIEFDILPEVKDILKDQEIRILLLLDSGVQKKTLINPGVAIFDSVKSGYIGILIVSSISTSTFQRYYSVNVGVNIAADSTVVSKITFPEDCSYNRNGLNRECPKCKRADRVVLIVYGLEIPLYDKNGKAIMKLPEHVNAGCDVSSCDPGWYCKRDDVKF